MFQVMNFRIGSIASKPILANNAGWLALPYLQNRTLTSKRFRVKKPKPAPFPYKEREYNDIISLFDKTLKRWDENTKLIVVEGPIGSGKHELAKNLAEEFEMKYVPDVTMDFDYINSYGYDLRNLNPKMPPSCQTFDENDFLRNPDGIGAAAFQTIKYQLRWIQYWRILEHLLNTGEGVVTVRSPFSTGVFANAMRKCNYIREPAKYYFDEVVRHTILYLYRPHLVIYLDVPVDQTIENIKKRNRDLEVNGKALTPEFLQHIENGYKDVYLREASIHSLVLHYNWVEGSDSEIVVEDIERLDFDKWVDEECEAPKLEDWRKEEYEFDYDRNMYSCEFDEHLAFFATIQIYDAPEVLISGEDQEIFTKVLEAAPGMKYADGYNPDRGDNVWFKNKFFGKFSFK